MKKERSLVPPAVPYDDWLIDQLRDREMSAAYLNASLEEGDQAAFMVALRNVAKARGGMSAFARETGMNRVALSRALSAHGNPELRSLKKLLEAAGLGLNVVVAEQKRAGYEVRTRSSVKRKNKRS